ncbi:MAG: HEAT repeat domain-containing protein [gamma proteobacterium endosymbiont of Lamellibrachia anaximandri]|nr:HEAT repeat domain-containing protein [gamma proteobacterium endosymbiont of Lamellibrachia anaximandri]MBL3534311.1 HEAT repeat domain-containing protein [gamma proteobacterium endosymbiont of Lamellibrachia anaximandri]
MSTPPDALLLLATGCAHCPAVLAALSRLLEEGRLGRLEAVNIVEHPEAAKAVGTRSVPWTRIGPFELEGMHSQSELAHWCELAASGKGFGEYFTHLLDTRRPHKVAEFIERDPASLTSLLALLEDSGTPMAARIGIGVVMEDLQGSEWLAAAEPVLTRMADATEANIRADIAHYLGLVATPEVIPLLRKLQQDEHPDVREIATDSLNELSP